MKKENRSTCKKWHYAALAAMVLLVVESDAMKHTIRFGGDVGFAYEPDQLDVLVGDTIVWEGDFEEHPLLFNAFPEGADGLYVDSGTEALYVATVPGSYRFICEVHSSMEGMFGIGSESSAKNAWRRHSSEQLLHSHTLGMKVRSKHYAPGVVLYGQSDLRGRRYEKNTNRVK